MPIIRGLSFLLETESLFHTHVSVAVVMLPYIEISLKNRTVVLNKHVVQSLHLTENVAVSDTAFLFSKLS